MKSVRRALTGLTAVFSLIPLVSATGFGSTPKVDPVSPCSQPSANYAVAIGFDSSNSVPTVSTNVNSSCVAAGNSVTFNLNPNANIASWDVRFPTTNPLFPASCTFGTQTSGSSQSCTVVSNVAGATYVYSVDVWVNGTKYTLDPKVVIKPSGKRRRRTTARPPAP